MKFAYQFQYHHNSVHLPSNHLCKDIDVPDFRQPSVRIRCSDRTPLHRRYRRLERNGVTSREIENNWNFYEVHFWNIVKETIRDVSLL